MDEQVVMHENNDVVEERENNAMPPPAEADACQAELGDATITTTVVDRAEVVQEQPMTDNGKGQEEEQAVKRSVKRVRTSGSVVLDPFDSRPVGGGEDEVVDAVDAVDVTTADVEKDKKEDDNAVTVLPAEPTAAAPASAPAPAPEAVVSREDAVRAQIDAKQRELDALEAEYDGLLKTLRDPDAGATIRRHIKLLKAYNEIRDVGLGLLGMIADTRGVRVAVVMGEYGLGVDD
ncbi:Swi5-domain-containing protein [Limtongia smithiae]|uniref:Swi5-domain-containing protein n=1 Tax=Limtongia smithiae TaxID=1125753 RepID=UPI0034CEC1AC